LRERGIGFDDRVRIFLGRCVIWQDVRRDYGEERFRAVGEAEGVVLHVVYTLRGTVIRIISLRRANRKEIAAWRSQK
jgi:uncharacterized DUF497 family protein